MKLGQVWHFADVATPRTEKQRSRSRGQGVGLNYESKKCMGPNVSGITFVIKRGRIWFAFKVDQMFLKAVNRCSTQELSLSFRTVLVRNERGQLAANAAYLDA